MLTRPSRSVSCSQHHAEPRQESGSGGASLEVGPPSTSCQGVSALSQVLKIPEIAVPSSITSLCSYNSCCCLPDESSQQRPWRQQICAPGCRAKVSEPQLPHPRMQRHNSSSIVVEKISNNLWKAPSTGPEHSRPSLNCSWHHFEECKEGGPFLWKYPQAGIPKQGSGSFFNSPNNVALKSRSIVDWTEVDSIFCSNFNLNFCSNSNSQPCPLGQVTLLLQATPIS